MPEQGTSPKSSASPSSSSSASMRCGSAWYSASAYVRTHSMYGLSARVSGASRVPRNPYKRLQGVIAAKMHGTLCAHR